MTDVKSSEGSSADDQGYCAGKPSKTSDRFNLYYQNTPESIFVVRVTRDGRFIYEGLNPAHEAATGISNEDLIGREPKDIFSAKDAAWVARQYRKCVESGKPFRYEETLNLPSGTGTWETRLVPVRNKAGHIETLLGTARNVTEQAAFREKPGSENAKERDLNATSPDLLFLLSNRGKCEYLSDSHHALAPFLRDNGKLRLASLSNGKGMLLHRRQWIEELRYVTSYEGEHCVEMDDDSLRWFRFQCRRWTPSDGRPSRWYGSAMDITDLKRDQRRLVQAEKQVTSILDSVDGCQLSVNRTWTITEVNNLAANWLGRDRDAFLGQDLFEIFPKLGRSRQIRAAMEQSGTRSFVRRSFIRPDRWLDIHLHPTENGLSILFRDITEQKEIEDANRENEKLFASTLDSLTTHIAILDSSGKIIAVNDAWSRFGETQGLELPEYGVGADYTAICEKSGTPEGLTFAQAVRDVLAGSQSRFRMAYACETPKRRLWFQLCITPCGTGKHRRVVLSHEDITEIKEAEENLHRLAGEVLTTQDRERRRIARELHDSTSQNLVGATLCLHKFLDSNAGLTTEAMEEARQALSLVEESLKEVRTLSHLMHPPALEQMGLVPALEGLLQGFEARSGIETRLSCAKTCTTTWRNLPEEAQIALYRVVQEGLTNIHRHSGSPWAKINLGRQNDDLVLEIKDGGKGYPRNRIRPPAGVGIAGMRVRIRQVGGRLDIRSTPKGTVIVVTIPCPKLREMPAQVAAYQ